MERLREALRQADLDGWLFVDHHERDPLAYRILGFRPARTPTRRWYYWIPAQGEPVRLVHRIEAGMLDMLPGQRILYSGWREMRDQLSSLLKDANRVAMQYSPDCAIPYISLVDAGTVELIRELGPEVVSSADLVQQFEARWNKQKLDSHLEAGRLIDKILGEVFQWLGMRVRGGIGVTEYEVQQLIRKSFAGNRLITDHGPIVAVNQHCSDPHYEPLPQRSSPIGMEDFVLIDLWAKLDQPGSVYYDITWTAFCGDEPKPEMEKVFTIVSTARDKAVAGIDRAIQSGQSIRGYEVDDIARQYIQEQGYGEYFIHRTGHSIGEDVHGTGANMDNLESHDDRRILPWTCFSVEPGVYLPEFGIRSEVNVFVDETGAKVTGSVQKELVRL